MIKKKKSLEELTEDERKELDYRASELRREVSQIVNRELEIRGDSVNPSINALCQHSGLLDLSPTAREKLSCGAREHEILYRQIVVPELVNIVRSITHNKNIFFNVFKPTTLNIQDIRGVLLSSFNNPQYHNKIADSTRAIKPETMRVLTGNEPLPEKNYESLQGVNYFLNVKQGVVVSYRPKDISRLSSKQTGKVDTVITKGYIEDLYGFIREAVLSQDSFWETDTYKEFIDTYKILVRTNPFNKERFDHSLTDVLVGDNLAGRLLVLDAEEAHRIQERIIRGRVSLGKKFDIVPGRVEDHRKRIYHKEKPGGVHMTIVSKGAAALPAELQIVSVPDEIVDKFGMSSHFRYKNERTK